MEENTNQSGLKKEDAIDRAKWRDGVYELSRNMSESGGENRILKMDLSQ